MPMPKFGHRRRSGQAPRKKRSNPENLTRVHGGLNVLERRFAVSDVIEHTGIITRALQQREITWSEVNKSIRFLQRFRTRFLAISQSARELAIAGAPLLPVANEKFRIQTIIFAGFDRQLKKIEELKSRQ